tara:strand:- start:124 stop:645 length:522 start_codon:yes stop_codon:yes gene_type:complete
MPRSTETYYSSHEDLLQEQKSMNTYRDYRQKRTGKTFESKQKTNTHQFNSKTYQYTTDSNESVVLEKKGFSFYKTNLDQKPRPTESSSTTYTASGNTIGGITNVTVSAADNAVDANTFTTGTVYTITYDGNSSQFTAGSTFVVSGNLIWPFENAGDVSAQFNGSITVTISSAS